MNTQQRNAGIAVAGCALFVIALFSSLFVIEEGRQAIITQFGKPIRTVQAAGLHWKVPFIQEVREIDLRILNWDGYPNQIPTRDKKYITVDTTARWKIVDPLLFIQTVQNESGARSRLDAILDATTRDVVSSHNLVETVRNSNQILDLLAEREKKIKEMRENASPDEDINEVVLALEEEEITGEIEKIAIGREQLSQMIVERAAKALQPIGIELIDVQLRRIMYENSVQREVYQRMISERERIAEKIRSIGKGEQAKIQGRVSRDLQQIESEAYRTVQTVKGTAEAEAIQVYARSLGRDPSFYEFTRKLEVYEGSFNDSSRLILSSGSDLFDVFRNGGKGR